MSSRFLDEVKEEGREEGIEKGREEGREESRKIVSNMLKKGYDEHEIKDITGLTLKRIREIKEQMTNNPKG